MAMNNQNKLLIAGGALVVALGGLMLTQRKASQNELQHSAMAVTLPDIKIAADDIDKVTKVHIKNAGKSEVTLQKDGDSWKVTSPVTAQANQQNVKSMFDNLKDIKTKDQIDKGQDLYGNYDLTDDKAVHVEVYKGNDKAFDAFFGKSGTRGQMVRLGDKPGVYVVSGYASYQYSREVKDWRDREIWKFEDANAVSVQIAGPKGLLSFSKNEDKWTGTVKGKAIENFEPEKVKDMLRTYKALTAEDFGDNKAPMETGLDKPESTVTITLKDNGGTYKLYVGNTSTGTSRYVQKDGSPNVYTLSSWTVEWATAGESKFQKPEAKDAGAKDGATKSASAKK